MQADARDFGYQTGKKTEDQVSALPHSVDMRKGKASGTGLKVCSVRTQTAFSTVEEK